MGTNTVRIPAPVVLDECVIDILDDGTRYLVDRATDARICKAYGFEQAKPKTWRGKTIFYTKADEDGFWCSYDDRKVTGRID